MRLKQAFAAFAALLAINTACAQATTNYYLELVVFHRAPDTAQTIQQYVPAPPVLIPTHFNSLGDMADVSPEQVVVQSLPTGSIRRLAKAVSQLQRKDGYRLLYAASWRQSLSNDRNKLLPLRVRGLERAPGVYELDGTIRILRQDRFFQTQVDLGFTELEAVPGLPATDHSAEEPSFWSDTSPVADAAQETARKLLSLDGLSQWEVTSSYRINTQSKLSAGEVTYMDHPFLGVLLYVEPIQTD